MDFILKYKHFFAILFWLWVAAILYFTLTSSNIQMTADIHNKTYRLDYLLHFLVYFGLSILYLLWKADNYFHLKAKSLFVFLIAAIIISGISEYLQRFIPNRTFNPIDYYANIAGILLGSFSPKLIFNKKTNSKPR